MRKSPRWSRPPSNFRLVDDTRFYTVWRRTGAPEPVLHVPIGSIQQPVGELQCRRIRRLARSAIRHHERLRFASRPPNVIGPIASSGLSAGANFVSADEDGLPTALFQSPGALNSQVRVPHSGTYQLWLGGDAGRKLTVLVDDRRVGSVAYQSGGDGNMMYVSRIHLPAGTHTITIVRGGGSLRPGDGAATLIDGIYLMRRGAWQEAVTTIPATAWHSLCGNTSLDWLEIVA
jgi:hypothetical protein